MSQVSASGAMLVSRDEQGLVSVLRVEDHDVMAGRAVERTDALTAKRLFFGGRVYLEDKWGRACARQLPLPLSVA